MGGRVMDEYIERGTLMRRIKEIHCAECDSYHGVRCRACWVDDTLDYIESEPAAEVTPVRHGYWRPILHVGGKTDYECSCCLGIIADVPDDDEHDLCAWCSMCGAKMDGGAEDASV